MKLAIVGLLICFALPVLAGDLKIVTRRTSSSPHNHANVDVLYIKGQRQRHEFHYDPGNSVTIYQCDLHREINLDEKTKTYHVYELDEHGLPKPPHVTAPPLRTTRSGNKVTIIADVVDTGERKNFFGMTAKHFIKTTRFEPQQTSCANYGSGQRVDGWYIDAPAGMECGPARRGVFGVFVIAGGCTDDLKVKHAGPTEAVIPIKETTTSDGKVTDRLELVELSQQPLDPKLFEVPPDYSEYSEVAAAVRFYWESLRQMLARMFR